MQSADGTMTDVMTTACDGYDAGVVEASLRRLLDGLGGVQAFFKPGATVLLKPNLLSARPPEQAVTTHPAVVRAMVRLCREAGAGRVWIGDSPAGMHPEAVLWEKTGMAAVAAETGAELKSFLGPVEPLVSPDGGATLPVPAWFRDVGAVINLPKLKTHGLTKLTGAMKNVFGLACGEAKAMSHARHPSPLRMSRFLATWYAVVKPHVVLNVLDAVVAMEGEGPANGRPHPAGLLLAGRDAAAVDAVCAAAIGESPLSIPMLREARERGLGETDPGRINIAGDGLPRLRALRLKPARTRLLYLLPDRLFGFATRLLRCRPEVAAARCSGCGICIRICPRQAIEARADRPATPAGIRSADCILCMCCVEACPRHAIRIRAPLDLWNRLVPRLRGKSDAP